MQRLFCVNVSDSKYSARFLLLYFFLPDLQPLIRLAPDYRGNHHGALAKRNQRVLAYAGFVFVSDCVSCGRQIKARQCDAARNAIMRARAARRNCEKRGLCDGVSRV